MTTNNSGKLSDIGVCGDQLVVNSASHINIQPSPSGADALKEMELFKDFLINKGIISNKEFERYKEDVELIERIN